MSDNKMIHEVLKFLVQSEPYPGGFSCGLDELIAGTKLDVGRMKMKELCETLIYNGHVRDTTSFDGFGIGTRTDSQDYFYEKWYLQMDQDDDTSSLVIRIEEDPHKEPGATRKLQNRSIWIYVIGVVLLGAIGVWQIGC